MSCRDLTACPLHIAHGRPEGGGGGQGALALWAGGTCTLKTQSSGFYGQNADIFRVASPPDPHQKLSAELEKS